MRTVRSYSRRLPPSCQMINEVSPGAFPLMSTSLALTATASISSPLAKEIRWIFIGLSMIRLFPTVTISLPGAPVGAAAS